MTKQTLIVGDPCLDEPRALQFQSDLTVAMNVGGRASLYILGRPFAENMPQNRIEHFLEAYRKLADLTLVGRAAPKWVQELPQWMECVDGALLSSRFNSKFYLLNDPNDDPDRDKTEFVTLHVNPDYPDDAATVCVHNEQWEPNTYGPGMLLAVYPLGIYARQMALGDYVAT